ncbi:MAG: hypothetical protein FWG98_15065 [Candidatus Cloacimonetes bacterium]|nr:hypothetical protein [Candidatus Cloacimonadota bacterium]
MKRKYVIDLKKDFKLWVVSIFLFVVSFLHSNDNIINSVCADSIAWFIQELEDFDTRYALHPNRFEVSEWIADQFTRFGYANVEKDYFLGEGASGKISYCPDFSTTLFHETKSGTGVYVYYVELYK